MKQKKTQKIHPNESIFLLGMMGCGKTSLGKKLAKEMGYDFVDLDDYIVKKNNVSINLIFEIEGESGFRMRETAGLKELLHLEKTIIATGGGVVVVKENRKLLLNKYCIYLKSSVSRIINKTKLSKKRPLLNNLNQDEKKEFLHHLIKQREKYYLSLANHFVKVKGDGLAAITNIIAHIEKNRG